MDEYKESGDLDIDLPSTCKRSIQNEKEGVPKRELKKRTSR
jgi:hypothetical protein